MDVVTTEKMYRLVRWSSGRWAPPVRIEFEPTDRCNLQCSFCWRWDPERSSSSLGPERDELDGEALLDPGFNLS